MAFRWRRRGHQSDCQFGAEQGSPDVALWEPITGPRGVRPGGAATKQLSQVVLLSQAGQAERKSWDFDPGHREGSQRETSKQLSTTCLVSVCTRGKYKCATITTESRLSLDIDDFPPIAFGLPGIPPKKRSPASLFNTDTLNGK
ncbi:hypothetical protein M747DRAFT_302647 [Aspergillus niger ATCC 13496]|uniref:Uncharacterized protein n=1 Tax=Aspergillus niger ATCC 13496 TaxID=1353008 RepID=A0A370CAA7_ASPNG|nr:hypothetical protein M747DRAFT_302647 [Aspergillus niger ATCC 13496]